MIIAKTQNSINATGHLLNMFSQSLDEMDGVEVTDSTEVRNKIGIFLSNQTELELAFQIEANTSIFDVSCATLNSLGDINPDKLFSSSRPSLVDFKKSVKEVF